MSYSVYLKASRELLDSLCKAVPGKFHGSDEHCKLFTRAKFQIWQIVLKVDYLIICIICDTDSVNKLTLQMYTLHKYK